MEHKRPLTDKEAHQIWGAMLPELAPLVANVIRKMGLPVAKTEELTAKPKSAHYGATYGSVKTRLLRDEQLHEDIIQHVCVEFFLRAVPRGRVWAENAGGWIATALMRAGWKLATERAREYLLEAGGRDGDAPLVEELPGAEPDGLSWLLVREDFERAALLLRDLSPEELRLLQAKADDSYADLARELGVAVGTLRTRACRLCAELRARYEAGKAVAERGTHDGRKKGKGGP